MPKKLNKSLEKISQWYKPFKKEVSMIKRDLKYWRFEFDEKKETILNKRTQGKMVLPKTTMVSNIRFGISCLEKLRVEEKEALRCQMKKREEKLQARIKLLKEKIKELKTKKWVQSRSERKRENLPRGN